MSFSEPRTTAQIAGDSRISSKQTAVRAGYMEMNSDFDGPEPLPLKERRRMGNHVAMIRWMG
jgi:hypothetical protein